MSVNLAAWYNDTYSVQTTWNFSKSRSRQFNYLANKQQFMWTFYCSYVTYSFHYDDLWFPLNELKGCYNLPKRAFAYIIPREIFPGINYKIWLFIQFITFSDFSNSKFTAKSFSTDFFVLLYSIRLINIKYFFII